MGNYRIRPSVRNQNTYVTRRRRRRVFTPKPVLFSSRLLYPCVFVITQVQRLEFQTDTVLVDGVPIESQNNTSGGVARV